ncbi:MAG TPA: zinc-binding dehydrogenase [Nocardioides sp.]|uniref:zinc-binding dehydrogenase n=1 Tax=Nocardioides sp. TaxID=35761 RepID=UPI002ED997F8
MRAVVTHQSELEVSEVPTPVPGAGQVLVRTLRTGICGSDLHARAHADVLADVAAGLGYATVMRPEHRVVMGHEILGEVVSYGPGTRRRWKRGTRVVAMPILRTGGAARLVGFDEAAPGGYAEHVLVQEALAFPVPDGVPDDAAVFTEPLAVALHAVRRAGVGRRPAVVVGCGPIGLAVIAMLKASGVRRVIASDLSPARRELARQCGADVVVDPRETDLWAELAVPGPLRSLPGYLDLAVEATGLLRKVPLLPWQRLMRAANVLGAGPAGPVVFECVGVPGILDEVIAGVPLQSRIVVVGVCMEPDTFRPAVAIHKEIDLRFVFGYDPAEFAAALDLISDGKVDPAPLHTGTVGLDGVAGAFADLADPERHAKILVDPSR